MDKLIDTFCSSFSRWEPIGQGLFILIMMGFVVTILTTPFYFLHAIIRPNNKLKLYDDSEETDVRTNKRSKQA